MKNSIRKLMISVILATDMARHAVILEKFQNKVKASISSEDDINITPTKFSKENPDDRRVLSLCFI